MALAQALVLLALLARTAAYLLSMVQLAFHAAHVLALALWELSLRSKNSHPNILKNPLPVGSGFFILGKKEYSTPHRFGTLFLTEGDTCANIHFMSTKKERVKFIIKRDAIVLLLGVLYAAFIKLTNIMVPCPIRKVTGWKCPGCGITRMCMALLSFDFGEAWRQNAFLCVAAPVVAYLIVKNDVTFAKDGSRKMNTVDTILGVVTIVAGIVFAILRNIF